MSPPLALILHGLGHDPATAVATFAPALPPAMPLLAPAGALPFGENGGRAWFGVTFIDGGPVADAAQEAASRADLIALAEALDRPALLLGFGQGGVIALTAFLARPDLFAGCAVAGGRLLLEALPGLPPMPAHRGKPVFWAHGRSDPAIAFAAAQAGRAALAAYDVSLAIVDHDGGHDLPRTAADGLRDWLDQLVQTP
ncbi:alpha/beta hydrolase [Sphingomonas colocasiae]|uniref:Phospholipase/carboxylesterase/thioesterase domain-containing protein n=1 Tax=Sphingomonas colocasiae TaxID=1848973 RepID=A0ABS7PTJ6_9SPHN|nr:hypothetical protein [Sphingomonas colocasiae]MBY8824314.1 hypothetical protein [Sphingomonas colocasiae]